MTKFDDWDRQPVIRLQWLLRNVASNGSPLDSVNERRPLSHAEIARRMHVVPSEVSKIVNLETSGRKRVSTNILGRAMIAFGVRPEFWWAEGDPDMRPDLLGATDLGERIGKLSELQDKLANLTADEDEEVHEPADSAIRQAIVAEIEFGGFVVRVRDAADPRFVARLVAELQQTLDIERQ
jgi:hypothetical protein